MKVYVVEACGRDYYAKDEFHSVWSTRELADACAARLREERWPEHYGYGLGALRWESAEVTDYEIDTEQP